MKAKSVPLCPESIGAPRYVTRVQPVCSIELAFHCVEEFGKMHENGKEDVNNNNCTGGQSNSGVSNPFPLISRASIKRPFSLASEREHQNSIRDYFRCRAFRSRSKTIHADTFTRNSHYGDLLSQGTFSSLVNNRIDQVKEFAYRRQSQTNLAKSPEKKSHMMIPKPIIDEVMAVDDYEDEDEDERPEVAHKTDDHFSMLLDGDRFNVEANESNGKQIQISSLNGCQDGTEGKLLSHSLTASGCLEFSHPLHTARYSGSGNKPKVDLLSSNVITRQHAKNKLGPISSTSKLGGVAKSKTVLIGKCSITNGGDLVKCEHSLGPKSNSSIQANKSTLHQFALQISLPPAAPKGSCFDSKCSSPFGSTHVPTEAEKAQFQRSLDSATTLVFHRRSGLPLASSPAPIRKSGTRFDFDSSLTSVNAIKKALFEKTPEGRDSVYPLRSRICFTSPTTTSALLGNFEESVLNGRLEPASIVNGFTAEIGASGTFCPKHKTLPVTVFFYTLQDTDKGEKMSSPYLGHINLGPKGYHVPRQGTVQVTLFNPNGTVVKMFVVRYNLSDMPPNSRTFLRQRTLFMPSDASEHHPEHRKWLRYLIHLRFQSSKSGRIHLHTDIRILVFRKHDLDVATLNGGMPYELRSFIQMPSNPKYSKNIKN